MAENAIRMRARYFAAEKRDVDCEPGRRRDGRRSPSQLRSVPDRRELIVMGQAMERLPDEYREVIQLRAVEGLSRAEIAARMGRSDGSVRMLLSRARTARAMWMERLERGQERSDRE